MNQELDNISEEVLKDDETLMQFLRGELSAEDETAFMQKLQQNPDLKARAVAVARLIKGLERKGIKDDEKLKSAFKKLSKQSKIKRIFVWVTSAAAVLVLVFGLRIFYVNSSYEKIAAEYENSFPFSEISRGNNDDLSAKLQNWTDNVLQNRDLDLTIEKLSKVFTQSQSETFNAYTNYFAVSGWYLALAYLKNHDVEKAKEVLKILADKKDDNPSVAKKAEEVLERIK
ncbi:MAG: hypothetical protein II956_12245 [Bacteroidales bacterium]|nr:hypothetical protein [Bacteroidales bacterium]